MIIYINMTRPPIHVVAIIALAWDFLCNSHEFSIRSWNRCNPSYHREVKNVQLTACLFECKIRPKCMAIQYQMTRRSCGILTTAYIDDSLIACSKYLIIERNAMGKVPELCGQYKKSDLTGECITECIIPTNPRIYSTIIGLPYADWNIQVKCDAGLFQNGSTKVTCKKDGYLSNTPRCEIDKEKNIALEKPTQLSSVYVSKFVEGLVFWSFYAVDGVEGGNMYEDLGAQTRSELNPWFLVDLGTVYQINEVAVYHRTDCCQKHFENIFIFVSSNKTELITNEPWDAGTFCNMKAEPPLSLFEHMVSFPCARDVHGQYLKIVRHDSYGTLQLCEVEVYGQTV